MVPRGNADDFMTWKGGEKFDPGFPGNYPKEQIPDGEVLDGKLGSLDFFIGWEEFFFFGGSQVGLVGPLLHEKLEAGGDDST